MSRASACITGVGLVSALGATLDATWAGLRAGRTGVRALAELGAAPAAADLPADAWRPPPSATARAGRGAIARELGTLGVGAGQLRYMSAAMRALHAAACQALALAGVVGTDRERLGIALAAHSGERTSASELAALCAGTDPATGRTDAGRYARALLARSPLSALRAQPGLLAGMLSQLHGIGGPCLTFIDDGVAGARALADACAGIDDGWCESWLVGGTFDLDDPWILRARASRPGALGSAAAVLILESEARAARRGVPILARVTAAESPRRPGTGVPRTRAARRRFVDRTAHLEALALLERLGDTLAAALPVTLALAVRCLLETADADRTASITLDAAGASVVVTAAARRARGARSGRRAPADDPAARGRSPSPAPIEA